MPVVLFFIETMETRSKCNGFFFSYASAHASVYTVKGNRYGIIANNRLCMNGWLLSNGKLSCFMNIIVDVWQCVPETTSLWSHVGGRAHD